MLRHRKNSSIKVSARKSKNQLDKTKSAGYNNSAKKSKRV